MTCPYSAATQIGQRAEGVLRFPQALAIGPDGSVYVADQGSHVVQVFGPDGVFRREVGIAGSKPGQLSAVGALAVAGDGSVLVADGANRIDRFDANGQLDELLGRDRQRRGQVPLRRRAAATRAAAGGGLAVSGDIVYVADTGNDRVQRFTLDGGHGAEIVPPGQLANPRGIAVRGTRLFVADDQHHRLVVFDTGGHLLRAVGQNGSGPGQLNFPYGVATDAPGRVFVADDLNHRVVRFSSGPRVPLQGPLGLLRDGAGPARLSARDRGRRGRQRLRGQHRQRPHRRLRQGRRAAALVRRLRPRAPGSSTRPWASRPTPAGIRAVTDSVNGRVQLLNPDGTLASSWGSPAPGPTILPDPVAVAFDAGGNAYVLDRRRSRIIVFARGDRAARCARSARRAAARASCSTRRRWRSTAAAPSYVADSGNERIARFGTGGSYLGATTGVGDGRGIAVSPTARAPTSPPPSHRIEVYDPSGSEIDEFGGEGSKIGKLESPGQIALDAAGNLWVADRGNNRIQEFGPDGERLGAFGVRGVGLGEFVHPSGLSLDCNGMLTVTDSDNNRVQQFALTAPAATPCAAPLPVGNPPAPKLPTLPAPLGPQVTLRVLRTTGLVSTRTLPLRLGCDTTCTITADRDGHPRRGAAEEAPARDGGARDGQAHARGRRHEDRAPDAVAGERAAAGQGAARAAGARRQRPDLRDGDDGEPAAVTKRLRATR